MTRTSHSWNLLEFWLIQWQLVVVFHQQHSPHSFRWVWPCCVYHQCIFHLSIQKFCLVVLAKKNKLIRVKDILYFIPWQHRWWVRFLPVCSHLWFTWFCFTWNCLKCDTLLCFLSVNLSIWWTTSFLPKDQSTNKYGIWSCKYKPFDISKYFIKGIQFNNKDKKNCRKLMHVVWKNKYCYLYLIFSNNKYRFLVVFFVTIIHLKTALFKSSWFPVLKFFLFKLIVAKENSPIIFFLSICR